MLHQNTIWGLNCCFLLSADASYEPCNTVTASDRRWKTSDLIIDELGSLKTLLSIFKTKRSSSARPKPSARYARTRIEDGLDEGANATRRWNCKKH